MTEMTPDQIEAFYTARGRRVIHAYGRQAVLDGIRENRRRYARDARSKALEKAAAMLHKRLRAELGENPAVVDVLLHVATMLGTLATLGMDGQNLLNVIAYVADDMARRPEQGSEEEADLLAAVTDTLDAVDDGAVTAEEALGRLREHVVAIAAGSRS